jgi:hypothetical protein
MTKFNIYLSLACFTLLACFTFLARETIRLNKELNRTEANTAIQLTEKDNEILTLSKKEMQLKVKYEQKDSAFNQACKDRDINAKKVSSLTKASMNYKDSIVTKLVEVPVFIEGQTKYIKVSNYSDGWNTIENRLTGDSLTNVLSGVDSIYIVNHFGWYGFKLFPRFLREKWNRTEWINKNPKMKYHINFTSQLDK